MAWSASAVAHVAPLSRYDLPDLPDLRQELARGEGIFHPWGRRAWPGVPKWASSTPSCALPRAQYVGRFDRRSATGAGGASPTMMLLCLGMRCADHVDSELGSDRACSSVERL